MTTDAVEERFAELERLGDQCADAAAKRYTLEHARKAVLADAMAAAEHRDPQRFKSAAAQDAEAHRSDAYKAWLAGYEAAVHEHERLRLKIRALEMRFEYWRSKEATRRAEITLR